MELGRGIEPKGPDSEMVTRRIGVLRHSHWPGPVIPAESSGPVKFPIILLGGKGEGGNATCPLPAYLAASKPHVPLGGMEGERAGYHAVAAASPVKSTHQQYAWSHV